MLFLSKVRCRGVYNYSITENTSKTLTLEPDESDRVLKSTDNYLLSALG